MPRSSSNAKPASSPYRPSRRRSSVPDVAIGTEESPMPVLPSAAENQEPEAHIKRPANEFILFRASVSKANWPEPFSARERDKSKYAGVLWRLLSDDEKKPWRDQAREVKQQHQQTYPGYKYKPSPKKGKARAASPSQAATSQSQHDSARPTTSQKNPDIRKDVADCYHLAPSNTAQTSGLSVFSQAGVRSGTSKASSSRQHRKQPVIVPTSTYHGQRNEAQVIPGANPIALPVLNYKVPATQALPQSLHNGRIKVEYQGGHLPNDALLFQGFDYTEANARIQARKQANFASVSAPSNFNTTGSADDDDVQTPRFLWDFATPTQSTQPEPRNQSWPNANF